MAVVCIEFMNLCYIKKCYLSISSSILSSKMMDELVSTAFAILIVIASIFCYSWIFKKPSKETALLPPGPRGLPILGYLPFLRTNLHRQFTELAHHYGPIYRLWLGKKLCLVINSPSLIKEVVRDQDTILANHDAPVAGLISTYGGMDVLWSPYGPYWRDMRKLFVRELLSNNNLEASYNMRKDEVRKAIRNVYTKIGTSIEIGELAFVTEFNVVMNLLWGGTIDGHKRAEFRKVASKVVDLIGKPNISDFFPVLARFDIQGIAKEMKNCLAHIDGILDNVINEHMKTDSSGGEEDNRKNDFLQILLELKEKNTSINLIQIKAILVDIAIGGTDTTATTVEWVMTEILRNPDVIKTVQQELTNVVGINKSVEEFHVAKLKYLDAVVKETFRLHPPLPLLVPRISSESCTVGRYTIPKGSRVFLNTWSVQMDPQIWENPSEFRPKRFLNGDGGKLWDYLGNSLEYLPFGSGRRICPGLHLAEKMVMYVLASLLHSFDWTIPEGQNLDVSETFGIVMRKTEPLFAIPSPRLSNLSLYA
ncbi:cytochrome P450 76C1-like [Olea europaea var. sylvestris]|uniref:cytochrome P450 76C1-like n=1 Tax=Olea europaea var. sylvestris TaxID=158386 RepID=UPI000C1D8AA3|nr:cytochrome P450 76C1-like [Olea europaea var. sylvestris]